jgi:predicted enzyme related to lactoylglutathione lyase
VSTANVSAVLFVKDLPSVAAFYAQALGMNVLASDEHHSRLECRGFELVVHQIPPHIAAGIVIERPPQRRTAGAIRLDFPLRSVAESRRKARELGGDIDDTPPEWADSSAKVFFGQDPEGNQFGVTEST